jgi:hypothetical protein
MSIDMEKAQRETLRWIILQALNAARPIGTSEAIVLSAVQAVPLQATLVELRRELGYLEDRKLVAVTGKDTPCWHASLTHHGIDVVEYTVDCHPGIARPPKWW